ncbi:MAG: DUF4265 domain-containing protein [Ktedonobacteraceae bacterium]|nr:DUF4265 domain-containing protein [Ktedonobacteraceae bacterium]
MKDEQDKSELISMQESQEIRLSFEEGWESIEYVTPLGGNMFRLDATPLLVDVEVAYGDIIEAELQANGVWRFCRVVTRSPWRHWDWILDKDFVESPAFLAWQQAIEAHGCVWERIFGGVFLVHLPPETDFDPELALEQIIARQKSPVKPDE